MGQHPLRPILRRNPLLLQPYLSQPFRRRTLVALNTDAWCNVQGAGFGPVPTSNTGYDNIDAFIWGKTPGASDGTSDTSSVRFDATCGAATALTPAPEAGEWFSEYFEMLLENANPKLV
ncbi:hypothetical protein HDV00_004999 [Rhizophlyctis rosea]|nr:hypothetical protein HDV00_004999 [Rhizophlyctis rosea]